MFGMGWGELLVLALVGLFVLGPERLPAAVRWSTDALHRVRGVLDSAKEQMNSPEFDELRRPLAELRQPLADLRDTRSAMRDALHGHPTGKEGDHKTPPRGAPATPEQREPE